MNTNPFTNTNRWSNRLLYAATRTLERIPGGNRAPLPAATHAAQAGEPRHVLVLRLGNLGDIVVTLPAFHALRRRYPNARMTLLTSPTKRGAPNATDVLEQDPCFDDIIIYYEDESGKPAFLRTLRRRIRGLDIDLAVVLPGDLSLFRNLAKHFALLASCNIRSIAGMQLVKPEERRIGQTPRLMGLLEELGASAIEPFPWIRIGEAERDHALELLAGCGDGPIIGMQCGAKRPANRWAPERFAQVARALIAEYDAHIVLTGSPGERDLAESVAERIDAPCLNLAGATNIVQLAAVAERCTAFLSNDTGTMHVAAAMGTPVVAVFSARDHPYRWYPYGEEHTILRTEIECGVCLEDVCPLFPSGISPRYDVPQCLQRITVDDVLEALRAKLGPRRPS